MANVCLKKFYHDDAEMYLKFDFLKCQKTVLLLCWTEKMVNDTKKQEDISEYLKYFSFHS